MPGKRKVVKVVAKRKRGKRRRKNQNFSVWTAKIPGQIVPDRMMVQLVYYDKEFIINNAGVNFANERYRSNSVFDPDPVTGSNGCTGFFEISSLYASYRVHAIKYEIELCNREAFPVTVYAGPLPEWNVDPGRNAAANANFIMTPYIKSKALSIAGGMDRALLKGYVNFKRLFGSKQVLYSGDLAAAVNTNPALITYFVVGMFVPESLTLALGCTGTLKLTYYTEMYNRQQIRDAP